MLAAKLFMAARYIESTFMLTPQVITRTIRIPAETGDECYIVTIITVKSVMRTFFAGSSFETI